MYSIFESLFLILDPIELYLLHVYLHVTLINLQLLIEITYTKLYVHINICIYK